MRFLSLVALAGLALILAAAFGQAEATARAQAAPPVIGAALEQSRAVDENDDSRVVVQLIVAGIAAGLVVVLGSGAYLLRRKLGLVAPRPDQGPGDRH